MNFALAPTRPMRAVAVQRPASQSVLRLTSAFHGVPVNAAAPSTIGISNGTEMSTTAVRLIQLIQLTRWMSHAALSRLSRTASAIPRHSSVSFVSSRLYHGPTSPRPLVPSSPRPDVPPSPRPVSRPAPSLSTLQMRHGVKKARLGRPADQRKALVRGLVTEVLRHGKITTTKTRAKAIRKYVDRMITLAKDGSLHARRQALAFVYDKDLVASLFEQAPERYAERNGGYSRVTTEIQRRRGDNSEMATIELV